MNVLPRAGSPTSTSASRRRARDDMGVVPSPCGRSKRGSEGTLLPGLKDAWPQGVLRPEDTEQDGSYVSEEETGYDQFDAQSLGDRSDAEHYDEDGYVPNIPELTEEQLEAQRDNGNIE